MEEQKHQLVERIHQAQNILVAVSSNPNVDQLAAAIGLTLALNKLDKHATAVFSGQVPSTLEFLKPQETLEKDTNSLRDFIIALDKSKADKLRYKVEDEVVRIFITPFRTSLSEKDLNFSQGDFNVDVVVCLGVAEQTDLDQAITAHGRILHDATIASVSVAGQSSLGSINWVDTGASSLSEMAVALLDELDKKVVDNQIATALLTGIVASTDRFSNTKTSPRTMSASSALMAAGADQQLIATKLEALTDGAKFEHDEPQEAAGPKNEQAPEHKAEPGTLEINHDDDHDGDSHEEPPKPPEPPQPQIKVDENGQIITEKPAHELPKITNVKGGGTDLSAPSFKRGDRDDEDFPSGLAGGSLTANADPELYDPASEELTLPAIDAPILSHNQSVLGKRQEPDVPAPPPFTPPPSFRPPQNDELPAPPAPFSPPPVPAGQPPKAEPQPVPAAPAPTWDTPKPQPAPSPSSAQAPASQPASPSPAWEPPKPSAVSSTAAPTLSEIERSVGSPHAADTLTQPVLDEAQTVDDARSAVEAAINNVAAAPVEPIAALNAQPLGGELHPEPTPPVPTLPASEPTPGNTPADQALDMPLPSNPFGPGQQAPAASVFTAPSLTPPPAPTTPPSAFPGVPAPGQAPSGQTPPPPVPPPMFPPLS